MKPNFTRSLILLSAVVLFYTACKKNTVKPTQTTAAKTDYASISSQLAVTFYKSITGQYGGANIGKGVTSPFSAKVGGTAASVTSPLCGFVVDTSYSYSVHSSKHPSPFDTTYTYSGSFRLAYTCSGGAVNGYVVDDSLGYNEQTYIAFNNSSNVGQHYTVKTLDQTGKLLSMNGSINTYVNLIGAFNESGAFFRAAYKLAGLTVNYGSGTADVTTGVATFHMVYTVYSLVIQSPPPTIYDGTIEFLGNHKARLTINPGHVYIVDLTTGVATPV